MQALYRDPAISEESRGHICFALAKASEDFEDTAKAFQFYVEGNALRKKQLGYEKAQDSRRIGRDFRFNISPRTSPAGRCVTDSQ